ncbi:MAG: hypothetical protein WBA46_14450 [Thermomicrobiales bacterium]
MSPAQILWGKIGDLLTGVERAVRPRKAWVGDDTDGLVTLATAIDQQAGARKHARLAGPALEPGTEVMVIPIDDTSMLVLGPIQRGPGVELSGIDVQQAGTLKGHTTVLNFVSGATVADGTGGRIDITVSGGGGGTVDTSFPALFPLNKTFAAGSYNCRLTPNASGTLVGSSTAGGQLHDTGRRTTAGGFTWAFIWSPALNWCWVITDALV